MYGCRKEKIAVGHYSLLELKGLRSVTASQLVPNVKSIFAISSYFCLALSLWPVNDHINGETLHLFQTYT